MISELKRDNFPLISYPRSDSHGGSSIYAVTVLWQECIRRGSLISVINSSWLMIIIVISHFGRMAVRFSVRPNKCTGVSQAVFYLFFHLIDTQFRNLGQFVTSWKKYVILLYLKYRDIVSEISWYHYYYLFLFVLFFMDNTIKKGVWYEWENVKKHNKYVRRKKYECYITRHIFAH